MKKNKAIYKKTTKGGGRTVRQIKVYADIDLLPELEKVTNRNRFINEAIRAQLKNS